jgi:hypothetical protein
MGKLLGASTFVSQKRVRDQGLTEGDSSIARRDLPVPQQSDVTWHFADDIRDEAVVLKNASGERYGHVTEVCQEGADQLRRERREGVVKARGNDAGGQTRRQI